MKRVLAGFLAMILMLSSIQINAFAAQPEKKTENGAAGKGSISVVVNFSYEEKTEIISKKNLKAQLLDSTGKVMGEVLLNGKTGENQECGVGGQEIKANTAMLNQEGTVLTTESVVGFYEVNFLDLPNNQTYRLALSGKGYRAYQSENIELKDFSKKVVVETRSQDFTMGDVNGDKSVDEKDLAEIENSLDNYNEKSDLNNDGVIDITDIALVNRNRNAMEKAVVYDTEMIASAVASLKELPTNVKVEGGAAEDIFSSDTASVKFSVDQGQKLNIPVSFEQPVQMEQIELNSPTANGAIEAGTANVIYEDEEGNVYSEDFDFSNEVPSGVYAIGEREGKSTVVINLGKRVAVKKVTITVTKVTGQDGQATYAVVEEIKFLKDIVPSNPVNGSTTPKNLRAMEGNESVTLMWKSVDNINGYMVKYGTKPGIYTDQVYVETPKAEILELKNLEKYYFIVYAVNDDWKSLPSEEVEATPQPNKIPAPPDFVKLVSGSNMLSVSWGKVKNALTYSVYYGEIPSGKDVPSSYVKAKDNLTDLSYKITGLKNGTTYGVYITSSNQMGESGASLLSIGKPKEEIINAPKIPTLERIPNSDVQSIKMTDTSNVSSEYPSPFNVWNVLDGDYNTHWTGWAYWKSKEFVFEFKEPKTMDYVVYIPRLDGNYKDNLYTYSIRVWDSQGNVKNLASSDNIKGDPRNKGFAILTFPKTEDIKKIGIAMTLSSGTGAVSLSEMAFYNYSGISEKVEALFGNKSFTKLADNVTQKQIDDVEAMLNNTEGYYVDKDVLLEEIAIARGLLANDTTVLGKLIDKVDSRNTTGNMKVINTFQPLGIVANAGKQIVIYADIPEGETVSIIPTQYYAEALAWSGSTIDLDRGRNIITIEQLTSLNTEKGGSIYLQYSGSAQDQIKLQIRGEYTSIPVLELSDWNQMDDAQRRAEISEYIQALDTYMTNFPTKNLQTNIRNSTEVSLPNVLLSLPADQVQKAIASGTDSMEAKIEKLYNNTLAWEELLTIMYKTHGIDDKNAERSRFNIRYARMFAGAFMYAGGAHIGIGYGSGGGVMQGRPTSVTGQNTANGLYGWGIAHEIGHVLDTLGKVEISNNIYSLFAQTYDGGNNTLPSRLEMSDKYEAIFQKTSIGAVGTSNDASLRLGMYWQLHLAYDKNPEDNFFNLVNKAFRADKGAGFEDDEKFAVAASYAAGKNLTEFFEHWGITLGSEARAKMSEYETESRKIYYLNDESHRAMLSGTTPKTGTISAELTLVQRNASITISGLDQENVQGYEITRNNQGVGFTSEPNFEEVIGSMNNKTVRYHIRAIDVLGNVIAEADTQAVKIEADNLIPRDSWISEVDEEGSIIVTMNNTDTAIAGIRIKGKTAQTLSVEQKQSAELQETEQPDEIQTETYQETQEQSTADASAMYETRALSGKGIFAETVMHSDSDLFSVTSSDASAETFAEVETETPAEVLTEMQTEMQTETPTEVSTETLTEIPTETQTEVSSEITNEAQSYAETETEAETTVPVETESEVETDTSAAAENMRTNAANEKVTIWAGDDKASFEKIKTFEESIISPIDKVYLFEKEDGRIDTYEKKYYKISHLPEDITIEDIDFVAYPGDNIEIGFQEFSENEKGYMIGRLSSDFVYADGEGTDGMISKGTLVVTGTLRGDPVYDEVMLYGKFNHISKDFENIELEERPINGYSLIFAEEPAEGDMTAINNGIWIFVPDVQKEAELTGGSGAECVMDSVLPAVIQARLYRTDDPTNADSKRMVSESLWINSPTDDTMPNIQFSTDTNGGTEN